MHLLKFKKRTKDDSGLTWEWRDNGNRDLLLFSVILLLTLVGLLILYPASSVISYRLTQESDYYFKRQLVWAAVGIASLFFFSLFPLRYLRKLALPSLLVTVLLLILVFVPGVGRAVSSNTESFHRWINLGYFSFQPSEFAKVSLVLFVCAFLTRWIGIEHDLKKMLLPASMGAVVLFLIVIEPQYGTFLSMLLVVVILFYISGFPMLRLLTISLALTPLLAILVFFWEYRLNRLRVWFDPYAFRHEGGYQLVTSFGAFDRGGIFGEPVASGFAHRYLTYGHTDFILSLYAEDFGWVGVMVLILLFILLLILVVRNLGYVEEPFAFLLGSGAVVMLILQAMLNMAVVTGLIPTTGVSLPFISYGGSSLVVSLIFGGILVNVSSYAKKSEEE